MKVIQFIMKMIHLVGVIFRVVLVRRVEDEPFTGFIHGGQEVHVLFEWQFEILCVDDCSFLELFVSRQPTEGV